MIMPILDVGVRRERYGIPAGMSFRGRRQKRHNRFAAKVFRRSERAPKTMMRKHRLIFGDSPDLTKYLSS